jgi:hypothetical protein
VTLLRPHFTLARRPSTSRPRAHTSAARSADVRSLKLTNAHLLLLDSMDSPHVLHKEESYRVLATWTIERMFDGSIVGNDWMTMVRNESSVVEGGNKVINNEVLLNG